MVRTPLTPEQIAAGRRLGAHLRAARGDRPLDEIARAASMSAETLRKIESGRLFTPAFGSVVALSVALGIDVQDLADAWLSAAGSAIAPAS
ncbi:helix-turn-helix domain-containing protein [Williamsia sp.]|uniref:helix-turn-helix domain-containing protein n=1 Tax=Williamsia sp. TaxID=1872085 RepID=UPI001A2CF851|nr:helix-turn-helix domain-containing protein [Williamsia sp.]MBJ7287840.1 helix-turn-helix domain-containing protein [Williamsia sp.]